MSTPTPTPTPKQVLKLQRQADKLYDAGEEEAASKTHKPNLLNTVIWLVETAQQVAGYHPHMCIYTGTCRLPSYILLHVRMRGPRQLQGRAAFTTVYLPRPHYHYHGSNHL